jgi:hypothetical protein
MSVWEDVKWRDQMIRDLREALKFYADEKNYQQRGWQGDPDKSWSGFGGHRDCLRFHASCRGR